MPGLAKLAASFDARRSKQYWQLLKRLYGGNDEAINAIKTIGDSGIYHGTAAESVNPILEEGLIAKMQSGQGKRYGEGSYLGSKEVAQGYGDVLVRLKKPSELKGTKDLYPDPSQAVKFTNEPDTIGLMRGNLHTLDELLAEKTFPDDIDRQDAFVRERRDILSRHVPWKRDVTELPNTPERYQLQYYGKSPHYQNAADIGMTSPLFSIRKQNDYVVAPGVPANLLTKG